MRAGGFKTVIILIALALVFVLGAMAGGSMATGHQGDTRGRVARCLPIATTADLDRCLGEGR
ncbi:hypothetical protein GCM10027169_00240 [Gordonia jinhuaensis]|uniref:Uncharacterized protein n=1 Tax=Gordonia jinhuaensis TaxID=1517702 RepID=A0A916WN49_9ACTN|nr:hypothetical protein [Gordonia jinhuaensis]GGB18254.1 hypothetical protein GCM10011489_02900 [Gordonia jinhuaensis]